VQNVYNLMQREDEALLFPLCRDRGIGITPYSPVAGGILTGKYERNIRPPDGSRLSLRPDGMVLSDRDFAAIEQLRRRAEALGTSTGALALAWVMSHPQVSAPVAGPARRAEHLKLLREALNTSVDEEERERIAELFRR
jgi:aryl-alcohol dehydrogenase-like predicted oxidoreductase